MDKLLGPGVWRKTKASQADLLPEDMIVEILLRLPVKSLVRFRCVCKAWHSLLTTSEFSTLHRQHSRRQFYLIQVDESMKPGSEDTYIGWDYRPIYKFALAPDDELDRLVHIDHPHLQSSSSGDHQIVNLRVIGSIDGLVCISVNFGTHIMIWNPATRQSYQLPSPSFPESHETLGFGCSQNNGYKVVRIVFNTSSKSRKAEVYDSSTNLWHKTADPPNLSYSSTRCIIANGMPYWSSPYDSIIWFHPIHDTFGTVKLPVVLFELNSIYGNIIAGLGEIRGAVAVLVVEINQDGDMTMTIRRLDVWMMDRPHGDAGPISWTEQFRVEGVPRLWQWFTCWKDGELVFDTSESHEGRELCLYDYLRDETKTVPWIGSRLRAPDEIFLCKESLISPHPSP